MKLLKVQMSKRERILTIVTTVSVSLGLIKYLYIKNHQETVKLASQLSLLEGQIATSQSILASQQKRSPASTSNDSNAKSPEELISEALKGQTPTRFFQEMTKVASELGLTLNRVETDISNMDNGLIRNRLRIDVSSPFIPLGKFLDFFEKSPFLVEVSAVEITRISDELQKCTSSIDLSLYSKETSL